MGKVDHILGELNKKYSVKIPKQETVHEIKEEPLDCDNNNMSEKEQETQNVVECYICQAIFSQKSTLKAHIASVHDGKKPYNRSKGVTKFLRDCGLPTNYEKKHGKIVLKENEIRKSRREWKIRIKMLKRSKQSNLWKLESRKHLMEKDGFTVNHQKLHSTAVTSIRKFGYFANRWRCVLRQNNCTSFVIIFFSTFVILFIDDSL